MRLKRPRRGWDWEATGLTVEQLDAAIKLRASTQTIIDSGQEPAAYGRSRVDTFAKRWLDDRRARGLKSVDDDDDRLRLHILNHEFESGRRLGAMFMDEVRPMHCRAVIRAACTKDRPPRREDLPPRKGLAPRTVINLNSLGKQLFSDAVADELIPSSPWWSRARSSPRSATPTPCGDSRRCSRPQRSGQSSGRPTNSCPSTVACFTPALLRRDAIRRGLRAQVARPH